MKKRTGLLLAVAQYTIQIDNQFLSSYRPQASSWWVSTWDNRTDQTGAETGGRRWEMVGRSEFNNDAIQTVTKSFSVRLTTTSSLYNYHGHGGIKLFLKLHYKWSSHHGSNSSQLPSIYWLNYHLLNVLQLHETSMKPAHKFYFSSLPLSDLLLVLELRILTDRKTCNFKFHSSFDSRLRCNLFSLPSVEMIGMIKFGCSVDWSQ